MTVRLSGWPFGYAAPAPRPHPSPATTAARVLSLARHPSTTPERLRAVVSGLPWRALTRAWVTSTSAPEVARTGTAELAMVQLREALLSEMETRRPRSFTADQVAKLTEAADDRPATRREPR